MEQKSITQSLRALWATLKMPVEAVWRREYTRHHVLFGIAVFVLAVFGLVAFLSLPPQRFPQYVIVNLETGMTVPDVVHHLEDEHVVRSSGLLNFVLAIFHKDEFIQAGEYRFDKALSVGEIANAITSGLYIVPPTRVLITEGLTGKQIVKVLEDTFLYDEAPRLSAEPFDEHIGYLFPDTYYIPRDYTEEDFIQLMLRTYEEKVGPLRPRIQESGLTEDEVINIASIVEREGSTVESKRRIAGIILNRLNMGMALQVDASLYYLFEKTSSQLTKADLAFDSPYNTYLYKGLPPTPISNPGLDSIEAVIDPIESEDLFYLTAPDGTFYYAETFAQHKLNKARHLP